MKSNLKLQLIFTDRVGIAADVASLLSRQGVNIAFFEMDVRADQAIIYLDAEGSQDTDWEFFLDQLRTLADLKEVSTIETLPQEERAKRLQVALDSIGDGILGIDSQGNVAIINRVAKHILGCDGREVTGTNIRELDQADQRLEKCLTGESFTNVKKNLIAPGGRFQFLATGKPIRDAAGRIVGAVEIMKDMEELKELSTVVAPSGQFSFSDMIGRSPALTEAITFAQKIARTDAVVSIYGESGTGKELFASAIHTESGRNGPFVPINCAALPENLLESELFGYVGGAFSGAQKDGKAGLFEVAGKGTLFLDEIAEMPLPLQAKMLRVLQEKKVRRIGGSKEIPVNARIITATNKNLAEMVEKKLFREDLYYRICVFPIYAPPLRERQEDISLLVEHFLFHLNSRLEKNWQSLAPEAMEKLLRYPWPGNIRELKNVIERAAILSDSPRIESEYILLGKEVGRAIQGTPEIDTGELATTPLPTLIERWEKHYISAALKQTRSKRQAARFLGITHTALINRLKKYGPDLD
ncbi:sigma 54-interacting transcriptional regulator [Geothermobacter hydrogeniphilus]|uniref:HTH-type transcriptional regulatory protein TyrR n=1 Tax=Geothermobacter hydrogeniphilus TaxID=1969733 RepID=A0A1X0XW63_9BACT|nr:sigma 54-interacting transcriptional regulator [Geothermobacter hydrogeniphilus]ORJ57130.1 Fis family transcriptional regulator [Geothermobacter hydrogeniphilus]